MSCFKGMTLPPLPYPLLQLGDGGAVIYSSPAPVLCTENDPDPNVIGHEIENSQG